MKSVKCAWCGGLFPLTKGPNVQRPKQHRVGGTTCPGSGQPLEVHQAIHRRAPPLVKDTQ